MGTSDSHIWEMIPSCMWTMVRLCFLPGVKYRISPAIFKIREKHHHHVAFNANVSSLKTIPYQTMFFEHHEVTCFISYSDSQNIPFGKLKRVIHLGIKDLFWSDLFIQFWPFNGSHKVPHCFPYRNYLLKLVQNLHSVCHLQCAHLFSAISRCGQGFSFHLQCAHSPLLIFASLSLCLQWVRCGHSKNNKP